MTRSRYSRSSRNSPAAISSARFRLVAATTRTSTSSRVVGADSLNLAVLEKPQQQRLHAQAHLADFVQK